MEEQENDQQELEEGMHPPPGPGIRGDAPDAEDEEQEQTES